MGERVPRYVLRPPTRTGPPPPVLYAWRAFAALAPEEIRRGTRLCHTMTKYDVMNLLLCENGMTVISIYFVIVQAHNPPNKAEKRLPYGISYTIE